MIELTRDPTDLRDQIYMPSLRLLRPQADPAGFSASQDPVSGFVPYPRRVQAKDGFCVGYALANLIDIHRVRAVDSDKDKSNALAAGVSPAMLYEMARRMEGRSEGPEGVRSLRSAVKGFYHFGCCREELWPIKKDRIKTTEIERFKDARQVTLGAYYRVRPLLNDYHSALAEADGILVSAEIHKGWHQKHPLSKGAPKDIRGRIEPQSGGGMAHAFVIVGYNAEGFLVLNSWGGDWGWYNDHPGVALWSYADWARTVMDAWVLRLGVPAPGAFQFSIGDQGINFGDFDIRAGSTACHYLLGHFAHLDDGKHVESGAYASSRNSVALTTEMLRDDAQGKWKRVLLTIGGSLLGLKDAFDVETRRRQQVQQIGGVYPYALLWCTDLIESANPVLTHLFQTAVDRVGPHSIRLSDEIEKVTAGIGRAFWREVKRAARIAGRHGANGGADGAAAELFDRFAATGARLHLLVDGAGVLLLAQYLESLSQLAAPGTMRKNRQRWKQFHDSVASIDLIAPTIECANFIRAYGPLIRRLNRRGGDRARLWVPSLDFEQRLSIGYYDGSMLDLVLHSFEGRRDAAYIGMSRGRSGIDALLGPGRPLDGLRICEIEPAEKRRRHEYHEVSLNPECNEAILRHISAAMRDSQPKG